MPILPNPRHEAFARAIFATTCDPKLYPTHGHAYNAAGYRARDAGKAGGSAEVNACNLLKKTKIAERVRELQVEANKRLEPKLDLSRETIGKRLRIASKIAEEDRNPNAMAVCELGMAKVFHNLNDDDGTSPDYASAQSMSDIGRKLLQSIGFKEPDDASIQEAIEAKNVFVAELERIRDAAQRLMIEHDD